MNKRPAFSYGGYEPQEGKVVHINAREWHAVEFILGGGQGRLLEGDVDEPSFPS
jgi:hypothetical protein